MVEDFILQPKIAEPAEGQVLVNLVTQAAKGRYGVKMAKDERPDEYFGMDSRSPKIWLVELQ